MVHRGHVSIIIKLYKSYATNGICVFLILLILKERVGCCWNGRHFNSYIFLNILSLYLTLRSKASIMCTLGACRQIGPKTAQTLIWCRPKSILLNFIAQLPPTQFVFYIHYGVFHFRWCVWKILSFRFNNFAINPMFYNCCLKRITKLAMSFIFKMKR